MLERIIRVEQAAETVRVFTPLGIRFWDPVRDAQVRDALVVRARPASGHGRTVEAFRTRGGVYAFQGFPGLYAVEHPEEEVTPGSPPQAIPFLLEVYDQQERFVPVVCSVELPLAYRGLLLSPLQDTLASPPPSNPPGFYLFTAPSRSIWPGVTAVRANLAVYPSMQPAAHARMEVEINGSTWHGIADQRGAIAVLFPYPRITPRPASPPAGSAIPLRQRQWPVTVRVYYEPAVLVNASGAQIPDLRNIRRQRPARIWPTMPGSPVAQLATAEVTWSLQFGEELIAQSTGSPTRQLLLEVESVTSPPHI
jgi:hypothetical protein